MAGEFQVSGHNAAAKPGDVAWWPEDHTNARKRRDRELFA
jgi:hypothetical protein